MDWDIYFYELQKKYLGFLQRKFANQISKAKDPDYAKSWFTSLMYLRFVLSGQDEFSEWAHKIFWHHLNLDFEKPISNFLSDFPDARMNFLENQRLKDEITSLKPQHLKLQYKSLIHKALRIPHRFEIDIPLELSSVLREETDTRKIVKYFVRLYTISEFDKWLKRNRHLVVSQDGLP